MCDPTDGHLLLDGGYVNNLPGNLHHSKLTNVFFVKKRTSVLNFHLENSSFLSSDFELLYRFLFFFISFSEFYESSHPPFLKRSFNFELDIFHLKANLYACHKINVMLIIIIVVTVMKNFYHDGNNSYQSSLPLIKRCANFWGSF